MALPTDDRVLARLYGNEAARAIVKLIETRWPDVNPRVQVLKHEPDGRSLLMIVGDANKLKTVEPLESLVRYTEGCVEALAEFGYATVPPPVPF